MTRAPFTALAALRRPMVVLTALVLAVPALTELSLDAATVDDLTLSSPSAGAEPFADAPPGWTVRDWRVERGRGLPGGTVRVAVGEPAGGSRPVADIVFVHGHSDRLDNHRSTFAEWNRAGLRVIAFDLPEHGGTEAGSLDSWLWEDTSRLLGEVERVTREDRRRPLVLGGFSLGGEIVVNTTVSPDLLAGLGRRPVAVALFSPALAVRPFSGGDGISRGRALVHAGGEAGAEPSPSIPAANPLFAGRLLAQGFRDRQQDFPGDITLFVATGGPRQDTYIDADAVGSWAREVAGQDRQVRLVTCAESRHAVDNEAWPIGALVRAASVDVIARVVPGVTPGSGQDDARGLPADRCVTAVDTVAGAAGASPAEAPEAGTRG